MQANNTRTLRIEGLRGVGRVELGLVRDQQVVTLIGANGIGKTKVLEALFQYYFYRNRLVSKELERTRAVPPESVVFSQVEEDGESQLQKPRQRITISGWQKQQKPGTHDLPVVFLGAQNRGYIRHESRTAPAIKTLSQRRAAYLAGVAEAMSTDFPG